MKVVWVIGELVFPPASGLFLYSTGFQTSLGDLPDVSVATIATVVGDLPAWKVQCLSVAPERRFGWRHLLKYPVMTARLPVSAMRESLRAALAGHDVDVLVVEHVKNGWALDYVSRHPDLRPPVVTYVSHNDEIAIFRDSVNDTKSSLVERAARAVDFLKIRRIQYRLLRKSDVVTAICPGDATAFADQGCGAEVVVAPPGFAEEDQRKQVWTPLGDTRRLVVLTGTFLWRLKLRNLVEFLEAAVEPFERHGIELAVVGRISPHELQDLRTRFPSCQIVGEVETVEPWLAQARVGVISEPRGGGFKMKALDLVAAGVPIVGMTRSLDGIPLVPNVDYVASDEVPSLVQQVIDHIDDVEMLDRMRHRSFDAFREKLDWSVTARSLVAAWDRARSGSPDGAGGPVGNAPDYRDSRNTRKAT
jgi:polysaccharide biosynthesis protein PslH